MQPAPPLFEEALATAFARYVSLMPLTCGQDARDGLAYVRDETLKQGKKAGMDADALRKLDGLFSHAALQGFHTRNAPRN